MYDCKIEIVPFLINFSTELNSRFKSKNNADEAVDVVF
jgi:hypothetical protein